MIQRNSSFFPFLVVFMVSVVASVAPRTAGAAEPILLFNGKDLSNFDSWLVDHHDADPDHVFQVVDQVDGAPAIRMSGQHYGGLITKEEYSDYHLVVEFRWGLVTWGNRKDRTKDSGILLHCVGPYGGSRPDFNGPWMRSIECQIIEGGTGDFILVGGYDQEGELSVPKLTVTAGRDRDCEAVYDPRAKAVEFQGGRINWYGRDPDWKDVLGFRGPNDVESPQGEWTRIEVICDGDAITNLVNGKVVNAGTGASLTRGKLLFQTEGAELFFRKIELTPLR